MSYSRGKYGIEFEAPVARRRGSPLPIVVVTLVALAAVVSFSVTLMRRVRASRAETNEVAAATSADGEPMHVLPAVDGLSDERSTKGTATADPTQVLIPVRDETAVRRPQKVENLLMRLEAAERKRDLVMAVDAIEQLRALPGAPAADLDDALARRLGNLNARWLFELSNAQWVTEVTVKGGDSLVRIAREHGATVASTMRLNPNVDPDRISVGQRLRVMNHPRFNLVVHRRARAADLQLNGKFFRRYDLVGPVLASAGAYELSSSARSFWAEKGLAFAPADRSELEMLLPAGTSVLVSEL